MGNKRNLIAAGLHKHEVEHSAHGYTQGPGRNGSGGTETVTILGEKFAIKLGDRDCSSSVTECWKKALVGTKYEGKLDKATYTGNMRSTFVNSGLFAAVPYTSANVKIYAKPGNVLLNDNNHTGMIQSATTCSEFLINEKGTITGGKVGDQTGRESRIRNISDYGRGWQWILVYNGKADPQPEKVKYELLKTTRVRTGRGFNFKVVRKLKKGEVVEVDRIVTTKAGRTWGHIGEYRWFVIEGKAGVRAKKC